MSASPFTAHPEGVLVRVWAVPRASRSEIKGLHDGRIKLRVMAPPEDGRANAEVIQLLTDHLGVKVELVGGATGREKLFLAHGLEIEEAVARFTP
jgi:uncharacterized protein (TIGR00251 family)